MKMTRSFTVKVKNGKMIIVIVVGRGNINFETKQTGF